MALASTRLESHELKCMLRRMAAESTFADVFQIYEAHIARVEHEAQLLRERNVQLELRRQERLHTQHRQYGQQQQYINHAIPDEEQADREEKEGRHRSSREISPLREKKGRAKVATASKIKEMGHQLRQLQRPHGKGKMASKSSADDDAAAAAAAVAMAESDAAATLRARVKDLQRQVRDLKQENTELRRRERQFLVQKRMVETTWARVQKVQTMAKGLEGSLASSRLDAARAEACVVEAEEEIFALRQREQALVLDRDKALLELDLVHRQLRGAGRRSRVQGSQAHQGGWEG